MSDSQMDSDRLDICSDKVISHMLSKTDVMHKYLEESAGKYHFDDFINFAIDYVKNEGVAVEGFDAVGAYDSPFSVDVVECQGIYFVQANEFDDIGYFLDKSAAEAAAEDLASFYQ